MSAIAKRRQTAPAREFEWRDGAGDFHKPSEMETRHLFHTISMIWNHSMPEEARTHEYKRYAFPPFYTAEYMQRAVRAILPELMSRDDLLPAWRARIEFMRTWLAIQEGHEVQWPKYIPSPQLRIAR